MVLTNSRAKYELLANSALTGTNTSATASIGKASTSTYFPTSNVAFSLRAISTTATDSLVLNLLTGSATASAFTAGNAQIETATAAGTVSAGGLASATVTASGLTGSPVTIPFSVTTGDTPTVWAEKARTALKANAAVAAMFDVGGSATAITLTRNPSSKFLHGGSNFNLYYASDSTLNIALSSGSATGITAAPTSANTNAGVASSGMKLFDGDGKDHEGNTLGTIAKIYAILIEAPTVGTSLSCAYSSLPGAVGNSTSIRKGSILQIFDGATASGTLTMAGGGGVSDVTITIIGELAASA